MRIALALCLALIASGALAKGEQPADPFLNGGRVQGEELARRIEAAEHHPLGSRENPVRTNGPGGQREYLTRLRCSDGRAPSFGRVGNFGPGVSNSIIDGYQVRCAGAEPAEAMIVMDMYFPDHRETRAAPGFTIAD